MKRLGFGLALLVLIALVIWGTYPVQGIWFPAQIRSASVDGRSVPRDRLPALYWDLQRSRLSDEPSKCLGWVDLQLTDGTPRQLRLSSSIALQRWTSDCP